MLSQPLLAPALTHIFATMTTIHNCTIGAWRRRFLLGLFQVVFAMRGRVNCANMARYSSFCEQTFRRHFAKGFQWMAFNLSVLQLRRHPAEPLISVFACTFVPKSGRRTYGLGLFFSSAVGRMCRGLEMSLLGVVATRSRRAFGLDATQTPPDLGRAQGAGCLRINFYLEQITDLLDRLAEVTYWVGDGYYAKRKVFEALTGADKHLVTRLRSVRKPTLPLP
jgi:hypothetical protein